MPPSVPANRAPSWRTYGKHLENLNGQTKLQRSSEYYYQIQRQMAVTNRSFGYFFVFNIANRSFYLEKIVFDAVFWTEKLSNLKLFWNTYVSPRLLITNIEKPKQTVDHSEIHSNIDIEMILLQDNLEITFDV